MTREAEIRRNKARGLRYKKPAVKGLTFFEIRDAIDDIAEECDLVQYWEDSDNETLVDALDGDDEEAQRFRMDFAVLSSDVDRFRDDLLAVDEPERFDDVLVAAGLGNNAGGGQGLYGFDSYEGDYFGLEPYAYRWAEQESVKRLERLTKKELIEQVAQSVCIAFSFIRIQDRYENLKVAMDILKAKNKEYLDSVKELNELYERIDWTYVTQETAGWTEEGKRIEKIGEMLPAEAWL